uniref:hypothetical protein n=1 Tax=Neorhizobium sp. EC2-8 TaxID=3129230 RepID=UPI0031017B5A
MGKHVARPDRHLAAEPQDHDFLILQSPVPIVTLWNEDGVMIYNDAYSDFAGRRHPGLLGSKVREGWPEVADFNDNVMKVCFAGGTLAIPIRKWSSTAPASRPRLL